LMWLDRRGAILDYKILPMADHLLQSHSHQAKDKSHRSSVSAQADRWGFRVDQQLPIILRSQA
jgi:hypothetical protein